MKQSFDLNSSIKASIANSTMLKQMDESKESALSMLHLAKLSGRKACHLARHMLGPNCAIGLRAGLVPLFVFTAAAHPQSDRQLQGVQEARKIDAGPSRERRR